MTDHDPLGDHDRLGVRASPRVFRHPVRLAHLGLGAFHRAHQAWYTQVANDDAEVTDGWGIAAFTGRTPDTAAVLAAQDDVYTLIVRDNEADSARMIESISVAADGGDRELWRRTLADPSVVVVTLTITEAGYRARGPESAGARLLDGLRARRDAGSPAIAVVSCDNLPNNGLVTREAVLAFAADDPELEHWIDSNVSFVSTMVDRITPATTEADRAIALELTGFADAAPVVTEPFSEWVLSGAFPGGRPRWEAAGARFTDDIEPFERRKLWLLNAGHSLLAYLGMLRGHTTIAGAMTDAECVRALEALWAEARIVLPFSDDEVDAVLASLRERFTNARIEHRLAQIAADGSQKLAPRILDAVAARAAAGLGPGDAEAGVIAAWILHLLVGDAADRGAGSLVDRLGALDDARRAAETVQLLASADTLRGIDDDLVAAVVRNLVALRDTRTFAITEPTRGAH